MSVSKGRDSPLPTVSVMSLCLDSAPLACRSNGGAEGVINLGLAKTRVVPRHLGEKRPWKSKSFREAAF